ncbi:MAG: radical SAM protein [Planctomycetes bacterium]|nr:radical SAM protein [Planctomycetota bacterium]MBI3845881.1 radical SAM protein [Planctomycetota bacterium]
MSEERIYHGQESVATKVLNKVRKAARLRSEGVPTKKIINVGKCRLSLKLRQPRVLGMCYHLMIEPTNLCNLKCPLCPTGEGTLERKKGNMTLETFQAVIDQLEDTLLDINITNYGEPFLNKHLVEMIAYAHKRGIFVNVGSNAHFFETPEACEAIVEAGLDNIYVSLDGATQATYEQYRVNGSFQLVIDNLRQLVAARKRLGRTNPVIELQFIVMKHNEHEIEAVRRISEELELDKLVLKAVSFNNAEYRDPVVQKRFVDKFQPMSEEFRLYRMAQGNVQWKDPIENRCDFLWRGAVILWDGTVVPCCMDPKGELPLGHVKDDLRKVWNGEPFVKLRRQMLADKKQIGLCADCAGIN